MFVKVFIFLSLLAICNSQSVEFGSCQNPNTQNFFGIANFVGKWYTIAKFPTMSWFEKCDFVEYSVNSTTAVVSIKHKNWNLLNWEQEQSGQATFNGCPSQGKFDASLSNSNINNSPYYILDTDYSTFAVVYACNPFMMFMKQEYVFILAKTRKMPESDLQKAYAALDTRSINRSRLIFVQQDGCDSLDPVPVPLVNAVISVLPVNSTNITTIIDNTNINTTVLLNGTMS